MPGEFLGWLRRNFQVTGGEPSLREQTPQTFMGCRFTYHPDGTVVIDMPKYVEGLLREVDMQHANPAATPMTKGFVVSLQDAPADHDAEQLVVSYVNKAFGTSYRQYADVISFYSHLVSSVGWIAHRVGPVLLQAHSFLCRVLSAPTVAGFQGVKRVLRYLAGKTNMHRAYRPGRLYDWRHGDLPSWSIESDASYADDPHDRRGQGRAGTLGVSRAKRPTLQSARRLVVLACLRTSRSPTLLAAPARRPSTIGTGWGFRPTPRRPHRSRCRQLRHCEPSRVAHSTVVAEQQAARRQRKVCS